MFTLSQLQIALKMRRWMKREEHDNLNVTKRYQRGGRPSVIDWWWVGDGPLPIDYLFTVQGDIHPHSSVFRKKVERTETRVSFLFDFVFIGPCW